MTILQVHIRLQMSNTAGLTLLTVPHSPQQFTTHLTTNQPPAWCDTRGLEEGLTLQPSPFTQYTPYPPTTQDAHYKTGTWMRQLATGTNVSTPFPDTPRGEDRKWLSAEIGWAVLNPQSDTHLRQGSSLTAETVPQHAWRRCAWPGT